MNTLTNHEHTSNLQRTRTFRTAPWGSPEVIMLLDNGNIVTEFETTTEEIRKQTYTTLKTWWCSGRLTHEQAVEWVRRICTLGDKRSPIHWTEKL